MRFPLRALILPLCTGGLLLSGCAGGLPTRPVQNRPSPELKQLRLDQQSLSERVQRLQDNLVLLEARLRDQQKTLEQLQSARAPEKGTSAGQIAPPVAPEPSRPAVTTEAPQPSATQTYLQAFADYAAARYADATEGFNLFLENFPDNDYAGNARYWLAECYLAQNRYERAAEEFRRAAELYPRNSKAPAALLKLAEVQEKLDEKGEAEQTLRLLRARYPQSDAAQKSFQAP
jgi:tol-pal system protein YbgF